MIVPRRPCPRGSAPMSSRRLGESPLVMKRSMRPELSAMPRAAYRAWTSPRTRSTVSCRTRSRSSSPAIARVASSRAPRTSPSDRLVWGGGMGPKPTRRAGESTGPDGPSKRAGGPCPAQVAGADHAGMERDSLAGGVSTGTEHPALSRRGFLGRAALAGGGLVAAAVAACTPGAASSSATPGWSFGPTVAPGGSAEPGSTAGASPAATPGSSMDHGSPGASPAAGGGHDEAALAVVKRFLDGEAASVEGQGNQPYGEPRVENGVKVFDFTIDEIEHRIDAQKDPIAALGFNATWPGPRVDVIEGDRIRAVFKN